ncbi:MAG: XRE family transcriptional regulator [Candidatus Omnitrophica bacterium]|nr:XRE family transcriptional regulator [Candidatus Omnitrophota bacterium]
MTLIWIAGIVGLMKALGKRVRLYRLRQNLTLADLAKRSGIALSTLSRIETGKMTGTLESHIAISKALGIRLPELYSDLDSNGPPLEIRRSSQKDRQFSIRGTHLTVLVSNALQKKMLPVIIQLPPGKASREEQPPAGTEKFLYVLKGKCAVSTGEQQIVLNQGDSAYFQAALQYSLKNVGSTKSLILSTSCPPAI